MSEFISTLNKLKRPELVDLANRFNLQVKIPNVSKLKKQELIIHLLMHVDAVKKVYYDDLSKEKIREKQGLPPLKERKKRELKPRDKTKVFEEIKPLVMEIDKLTEEIKETKEQSKKESLFKQIRKIHTKINRLSKYLELTQEEKKALEEEQKRKEEEEMKADEEERRSKETKEQKIYRLNNEISELNKQIKNISNKNKIINKSLDKTNDEEEIIFLNSELQKNQNKLKKLESDLEKKSIELKSIEPKKEEKKSIESKKEEKQKTLKDASNKELINIIDLHYNCGSFYSGLQLSSNLKRIKRQEQQLKELKLKYNFEDIKEVKKEIESRFKENDNINNWLDNDYDEYYKNCFSKNYKPLDKYLSNINKKKEEPKKEIENFDILSGKLQQLIYSTNINDIVKALSKLKYKGKILTNKIMLNMQLLQNFNTIDKIKSLINELEALKSK